MDKNIVISFTADTGGLDEASNKLRELATREQELINIAKELEVTKRVAQFDAKNAQEQTKATVEYGKRIVDVRKELTKTRASLEDMRKSHKNLEKEVSSGVIEGNFRKVRRELEEQLRTMRLNGDAGSETYKKLTAELTRLNVAQREVSAEMRNQSSATFAFDTILQGAQLATGGYSILAGAMGLAGVENEDLQKTMVKLQSAIAITTGLQQVQNAVMGEGNIIQRISTLQSKAKTKAEALATAGTARATIAQKLFNLVAWMNPYVLLAVALVSVVGALYLFSQKTETASEKQKKLNDLQREALDLKDQYANALKTEGNRRVKALERELELMQAQQASEGQLALKRRQIFEEQERNALAQNNHYGEEFSNLDKNKKKVEDLEGVLKRINKAQLDKEGKFKIEVDGKVKYMNTNNVKELDKFKELTLERIGILEPKIKVVQEVDDNLSDIQNKQKIQEAKDLKEANERAKRSAVALAEYKVLQTKNGTKQELDAQIEASNVKLKADLQNAQLTYNERKRRTIESEKEIAKLQEGYATARMQEDLAMMDAIIGAQEEHTTSRHNVELARLDKQRELELSNDDITAKQKEVIELKYQTARKKLEDDFAQYRNEIEVNTTIANVNAKLANVKEGSMQEYNLKMELAQAQAQLDRDSITTSVKNEEERAAKILEINANLKKEIATLQVDRDISLLGNVADKDVLEVTKMYEQGEMSKRKYENTLRSINVKVLQDEIELRQEAGEDTIDLEQQLSEARIEIMGEEGEARKAMAEEIFNTMTMFATMGFEQDKARIQQELADLDHYYTTDAEAAKKNKDLKLISEEEMTRRKLELKKKAAKAEKEEAIFNTLLSSGQAIARAFKDFPMPYSAIIATLVGVQTLAQVNAIRSRPLPKYWKGRKGGEGQHALVGEYGPELMYVPKGASIMPHLQTRKALNGDMGVMNQWRMPALANNYPSMPSISQSVINNAKASPIAKDINYDQMGQAIAKYQKPAPQPNITVKYDGSGVSIGKDGNITKFSNIR